MRITSAAAFSPSQGHFRPIQLVLPAGPRPLRPENGLVPRRKPVGAAGSPSLFECQKARGRRDARRPLPCPAKHAREHGLHFPMGGEIGTRPDGPRVSRRSFCRPSRQGAGAARASSAYRRCRPSAGRRERATRNAHAATETYRPPFKDVTVRHSMAMPESFDAEIP
jgi:hypothetical protein